MCTSRSSPRSSPSALSRSFLVVSVRTGRDDERSPELAAAEAAPDAPRHEPPGLDFFPWLRLAVPQFVARGRDLDVRILLGVPTKSRVFHVVIPCPGALRDRLHFHFPSLRRRHPGPVGVTGEEPAGRRAVRDEQ